MDVLKQGKKYITDDLFNLIKEDLKLKNTDNNNLNIDNDLDGLNDEIATYKYLLLLCSYSSFAGTTPFCNDKKINKKSG